MRLIDSSALVRYFSKEEGWERVAQYVSDSVTMTLAVSEVGHSLLKKVRKHEMQEEVAKELLEGYAHRAVLFHDEEYTGVAFQTAHSKGVTFYDSLFIAACLAESYDLVTCDENQAKIARELGLGVILC